MPTFDWPRFLARHNVPYVTRGPNTGRGRISVRCPWCGESDPSEHLGISLRDLGYNCWRNPNHKGRSRSYLIQALLNCPADEARRLAGEDNTPDPLPDVDFAKQMAGWLGNPVDEVRPERPKLLPEFKRLAHRDLSRPFYDYFYDRGYMRNGVDWLVEAYNLHYALRGDFRYRIIIPVYTERGDLATWTARTISSSDGLRYKTLKEHSPKQYLLGLPWLRQRSNPRVLVVCEGPFDAFRISSLGHRRGVYGTCLFGLSVSDAQVAQLIKLMRQFDRLVLLLDPDASMVALTLQERMAMLHVQLGEVPKGVDDPGELEQHHADALMEKWLS